MLQKSTNIQNLAKALLAFNAKPLKIQKSAKNPFFKSKYASLEDILDAISIPLYEAGLVLSCYPSGQHGLICVLMHADSGEFIETYYEVEGHKNTSQERGSALSYQRRYAILAMLNLNVCDEMDDDGHANSRPDLKQDQKTIAKPAPTQNNITEVREVIVDKLPVLATTPISKADDAHKPWLNIGSKEYMGAIEKMKVGKSSIKELRNYFKISKATEQALKDAAVEIF
jgi:hypothetical protein